jgi:hypothetical protein
MTTRRFFSVSTMNDPEDNGITTTFATAREAADFAEWAREQGLWFVEIWS